MENKSNTMNKTPVILLSLLLAAAIILCILLYGKYSDTRDTLAICEKKFTEVNKKSLQINKKATALREQIREKDKDLTELEKEKERVSDLETAIADKDQTLSALKDRSVKLEKELEAAQKEKAQTVSGLKERLSKLKESLAKEKKSRELLRSKLDSNEKKIEGLRQNLLTFQREESQLTKTLGDLKSTHDAIVTNLRKQVQNKEVIIKNLEQKLSITFLDRILFESGRATVTEEGKAVLKKVGEQLKSVKNSSIRVVGHTDNVPIKMMHRDRFPTNWELSSARASAVVRYLHNETGLDPADLEAVGRSFYEPVAGNDTEEGRAQNRRVNIIIAPKIKP